VLRCELIPHGSAASFQSRQLGEPLEDKTHGKRCLLIYQLLTDCEAVVEADHALIICTSHVLRQVLHDSPNPSPADDDKSTTRRQPGEGDVAVEDGHKRDIDV